MTSSSARRKQTAEDRPAPGLAGLHPLFKAAAAPEPREERGLAWLEPLVARAEAAPGPLCALELDVQGIHCASGVWLIPA